MGIQRQCTEHAARREIESMKRDARFALLHQNQQFQIAVQENPLRASEAVRQDVQEPPERYQVMMVQEIHAVRTWYERRIEVSGRRVAQVVGSEAHVAV